MRENAQHKTLFAVKDRVLEPPAFYRIVCEKSTPQRVLQSPHRNRIQLPDFGAPRQIVRGGTAHAFPGLLSSGKRKYDFLKRTPNLRFDVSNRSNAIDREFVRSQCVTPFDQPPGLCRREIARGQIPLDNGQILRSWIALLAFITPQGPGDEDVADLRLL